MGAFLRAELRAADGTLLATRAAHNAVLQSGARLIADLFAGRGAPITHMMVGTSDAPETETFSTAALQNDPSARVVQQSRVHQRLMNRRGHGGVETKPPRQRRRGKELRKVVVVRQLPRPVQVQRTYHPLPLLGTIARRCHVIP